MTQQQRQELSSFVLPDNGLTYSPITHMQAFELMEEELDKNGFVIRNERYNYSKGGQVLVGHLGLEMESDSELQFELAFLNSYNKSRKFTAAAGSSVVICTNSHILGSTEYGTIKRRHVGEAWKDVSEQLRGIIGNAHDVFEKLIQQKERMKEVEISRKVTAQLIGNLYINEGIMNSEQLSIIKGELDNPSYDYGTPQNNLWTVYNAVTAGLRETTPKDYIVKHQRLNEVITQEFSL